MPSHLFVRLGRYHDAAAANVAALAADRADSDACQQPYEPEHNAQMLIWAANMAGEVSNTWPKSAEVFWLAVLSCCQICRKEISTHSYS